MARGYLEHYPRTVFLISHDRDLLETAVDQILHLERGKLTLYRGGYDPSRINARARRARC